MMHHNFKDITGETFNDLTVLGIAYKDDSGHYKWHCRCKCGTETIVFGHSLRSGGTKGCGCKAGKSITTHGETGSPFYIKWESMRCRCNNKKAYIHLTITPRWNKYLNFKEDMYESYLEHVSIHGKHNTTLDRIDGREGYLKANCRWATHSVQNKNRLDYTGKNLSLYQG